MAIRWRPMPVACSTPRLRISVVARVSTGDIGTCCVFFPAKASLKRSGDCPRLLSAVRRRRSSRNICARSGTSTLVKQASVRQLCSRHGEGKAVEPSENNWQCPRLQWILFASAVLIGVLIFVRLKFGGLLGPRAANALVIQASSGFQSGSIAPRFSMKLPVIGTLLLGEVTPGWVYFLLLMAAGCGLFVSEEALNVWVGASLGRLLTFESKEAFVTSFLANTPHILSTILWVYWGVCISDMIPFFAGKMASRSGDQLSQKLGVSKDQYEQVMRTIQRYGNLVGFVERFSIGVRNPTSFLAGFAGILPSRFFAGVCLGGLFTLPIQMTVGVVLRERPVAALAGVAAFVGAWTAFPYAAAGIASLYYLVRRYTDGADGAGKSFQ